MQTVPLRFRAPRPQAYDLEPQSLGEHIRRRRLIRGLEQKDVAAQLGVTESAVNNWENGRNEPTNRCVPAIVRFLGYAPFTEPESIPDRLRAKRRAMGWSIRKAAAALGVDPTTWGDWEHGKVILFRAHRVLVARLLGLPERQINNAMSASWNQSHK